MAENRSIIVPFSFHFLRIGTNRKKRTLTINELISEIVPFWENGTNGTIGTIGDRNGWYMLFPFCNSGFEMGSTHKREGIIKRIARCVLVGQSRFCCPLVAKDVIEFKSTAIQSQMKNKESRSRKLTVRFTLVEHESLKAKCTLAGLTPSELIRQNLSASQIQAKLTEDEKDGVRQLSGMANNINQIARVLNGSQEYDKVRLSLLEMRMKIETVLTRLLN